MRLKDRVYEMVIEGFSGREIARALDANEKTIYFHILDLDKTGYIEKNDYQAGHGKQARYKATGKKLFTEDKPELYIPHFSFFNDPFNLAGMR